jgi:hypothetical protein
MREALTLRPALLCDEPRKTLTAVTAALMLRLLPAAVFDRLLRRVKPGLAGGLA